MYNENKDGFQVNNFLKGTSGQKMVAVSFTGCRFLLMRKVKPELRDMVEDGFFFFLSFPCANRHWTRKGKASVWTFKGLLRQLGSNFEITGFSCFVF